MSKSPLKLEQTVIEL